MTEPRKESQFNVKLVSMTQPSRNLDGVDTPDELVAFTARVSNPSNQLNHDTATKLLKYLIKNKHWSPLEMVDATVEVVAPRDISRQILRHVSFRYQEFSQRYAAVLDPPFIREARLQDDKNRQNSKATDDIDLHQWWEAEQWAVWERATLAYMRALEAGIAKECARAVLPEGMTPSRLYMKGSLRSWLHYCQLRMGNGTQLEHQCVANTVWAILCEQFPFLHDIEG